MSVYLHDWSSQEDMIRDFNITAEDLANAEILVASYSYEDYSGSAYVLFRRNGHLYEVHGSHCSCYGLSEYGTTQWQPEETTAEAILHRLNEGTWGKESEIADHIRKALSPMTTRVTVPLVVSFNLLNDDNLDNLLDRLTDSIQVEMTFVRKPVVEIEPQGLTFEHKVDHEAILDKLNTRIGSHATALLLENTDTHALPDIIASLTGITIQEAALFVENRK